MKSFIHLALITLVTMACFACQNSNPSTNVATTQVTKEDVKQAVLDALAEQKTNDTIKQHNGADFTFSSPVTETSKPIDSLCSLPTCTGKQSYYVSLQDSMFVGGCSGDRSELIYKKGFIPSQLIHLVTSNDAQYVGFGTYNGQTHVQYFSIDANSNVTFIQNSDVSGQNGLKSLVRDLLSKQKIEKWTKGVLVGTTLRRIKFGS